MNATVMGPLGEEVPVEMGSYGIGVSRLVAAIIERLTARPASSGRKRWRRSRSASLTLSRMILSAKGCARPSTPRSIVRASKSCTMIEPSDRGEVLRNGPDRPATTYHCRTARCQGRHGRAEAAPPASGGDERRSGPRSISAREAQYPMFSAFEWLVAIRCLRRVGRKALFRSSRSSPSLGIFLGVATSIIVMSVMNGFRQENADPHSRPERSLSVLAE